METKVVKKDHYENGAKVQVTNGEHKIIIGREITNLYRMRDFTVYRHDMILGEVIEIKRVESFAVSGSFAQLSAFKEVAEQLGFKYDYNFNEFTERKCNNRVLYFAICKKEGVNLFGIGEFSLTGSDKAYNLPTDYSQAYQHAQSLMEQIKEDEAEREAEKKAKQWPKYYKSKLSNNIFKFDKEYHAIEANGKNEDCHYPACIKDGSFIEITESEYDQAVKEMNEKKAEESAISNLKYKLEAGQPKPKLRHFLGQEYTRLNGIVKDSNGNVVNVQTVLNFAKWMLK